MNYYFILNSVPGRGRHRLKKMGSRVFNYHLFIWDCASSFIKRMKIAEDMKSPVWEVELVIE